ncbi:hypothetical protein LZ554_001718 [Drepanopeziza brunnea f. sp. 'monogermtubi']|nr:hypothetical protein LZ554_001718 [Drepanopeziza brunnea f. sp. 'monogermtubi']
MDHAWLDSLSEDWVSQPRSSGSPAPSLPSLSNSTSDSSQKSRAASSRIPKYNVRRQTWTAPQNCEESPLNERSTNETNIPLSQRVQGRQSKLREITNGTRGRRLSRTFSASTTQSVQYHTVEHKSASLSPKKGIHETPEWKRRLLHGDVAYGEQCDLFSPAGLENMFRPPPTQSMSPSKLGAAQTPEDVSIAMPSSPPPYHKDRGQESDQFMDEEPQGTQDRQQPRGMNYRLANQGGSEFSVNDLSQSSMFQPSKISFRQSQEVNIRSDSISEPESSALRLQDPSRTVSGQIDMRNEEFSPVYVARHNTADGKIDYAALNLPPDELKRKFASIRGSTPGHSDQDVDDISGAAPLDTTVGTDDFAHNGRFVNLRRGGQSQEGSFQKRMLSPSSLSAVDESVMMPESSMQASTPKQLPNIRKTRISNEHQAAEPDQIPATELRTPQQSPKKTKSNSGSPLKIFGTYDTFTNQKLLRRLSQFEGDIDHSGDDLPEQAQEPNRPGTNDAFEPMTDKYLNQSLPKRKSKRKMSSFGAGELDSFQFSEGLSFNSAELKDGEQENVTLPVLNRHTQTSFKFQLEPSPDLSEVATVHHRAKYTTITSSTRQTASIRNSVRPESSSSQSPNISPDEPEDLKTPRKRNGDSEGKRLPKTPLKDPTPKRRRTLNRVDSVDSVHADEEELLGDLDSLRETHQQMQSVVGKKRKDAKHGDDQQAANPTVLAMRQILRPRTPTPSQRSSLQHERAPSLEAKLTNSEQARLLQEQKIAKIQAELDATGPFKNSATLGVGKNMLDDSRKGSITTQDFLDEAKMIMAGIRDKTRPRSGLASVEESESENDRAKSTESGPQYSGGLEELDDSYQESTVEPFSRPPSRDGKPVSRLPHKQEDPALLDHLRKYQEKSDIDGVIASSMRSIAMAKEAADEAKDLDRRTDETIHRLSMQSLNSGNIESDPPNIRISENPDLYRKRKHSTSTIHAGDGDRNEVEFPSHGSSASSGQSTARSIPTGSSRGSDSRRVIAPHTVSHLIPEQLAGMVFDHEGKRWIKSKSASAENGAKNFLPSDETDDDPFGDIPDLSVDETQELQRIKAVAAKLKQEERLAQENREDGQFSGVKLFTQPQFIPPRQLSQIQEQKRSPEPVKVAQSVPELGLLESITKSAMRKHDPVEYESIRHSRKTEYSEKQEIVEEVEREISIYEDRVDPDSPRRRNVTISFSSPLASVIQAPGYDVDSSFEPDVEAAGHSAQDVDDSVGEDSIIVTKNDPEPSQRNISTKIRSAIRSTSRRMSVGGHKFQARPVSRIDEQDEDSIIENAKDRQRRSISIVVSTPVAPRQSSNATLVTPRPSHEIGTLTLTPLSDFTVHQADQSLGLDVSYVAQRNRFSLGNDAKKTLSLSIKGLVEKLTEVEPYEPFWEHMKELSLKDKRLTNIHKLDEFCEELEELDVSHNQIEQLDGVPKTVRHLRIAHNCLTDLVTWKHLHNLQYIDVSNNGLESLSAFKSLVHLRSLRADNNKISGLDGVSQLDGLLSLRLRGNSVRSLDLGGTNLQRLTDLDLKGNQVCTLRGLQELRSLATLNLEDNSLCDISMDAAQTMSTLKYLKLSGNNLEAIDVSLFPNLRLLYLDRNRLGTVSGLLKTKYLDSLSMREQQEGAVINPSFISEAFEIRKLFLSGNYLGSFEPQADFLNLQYLELANCGLETLPVDFGQVFTNVRVLNLNFNALKDIKPLIGIQRLKKLFLAGNRLVRLRSTACVLAQFPGITTADLRNNPLTQGFYPPIIESRMVGLHNDEEKAAVEPFTLGKADREKDVRYVACLDMDTRMLRRTFEVMVLSSCLRMRVLDGLDVERALLTRKDMVFDALVEVGIFEYDPNQSHSEDQVEEASEDTVTPDPKTEPIPPSPVWQAEDSFA